MTQRRARKAVDRALSHSLQKECGITELVANTLVARGFTTVQGVQEHLNPDISKSWGDPKLICGLTEVTDAMIRAIETKKRILVFGDFDVDGISATAIMVSALRSLDVEVDYLIPNRVDEGYGLTEAVLPRIFERDPELVITVDCGISARSEVEQLLLHGIEVLVTDHHQPSESIPLNIPIANPKLEEDTASSILSGAGVALKLIALIGRHFGKPLLWHEYLDLATLGTLADLMPLTGENRALVAAGLSMMGKNPRPGIAAALASTRIGAEPLKSTAMSFTLIPRLNAAGRMGDPILALQLLLTDDHMQAQMLASELEAINENRRLIETEIFTEARAEAEKVLNGKNILVIKGKNWHEGVKGIVAARLVAHFDVPVIVFTENDDELRGSGRSNGTGNLFRAVEQCSDLTIRFGGHEAAVGVTIDTQSFDEFKSRLEEIFENELPTNLAHQLMLDDEARLSQADLKSAAQISMLEPFGKENEEPLYITRAVYLKNTRAVGINKNHLSCTVTDGRTNVQAIFFKCKDIEDYLGCAKPVDIVYNLRLDEWNGNLRAKLHIRDMERHHETPVVSEKRPEPSKSRAITHEAYADGKPYGPGKNNNLKLKWKAKAQTDQQDVWGDLASEILGSEVQLFDSQKQALEALRQGYSVLTIMATGRGKSLIFQAYAAHQALLKDKASVFIYPLRALLADHSLFIVERFSRLGLSACSIYGESSPEEKDRIFQRLYEGEADVLLTTPEFFKLHDWRFYQSERIGFIVFDEAHHIQTELQTGRNAYHQLQSCKNTFVDAQFLAVTATSDDRITRGICEALSIELVIVDDTIRENLGVDDARNLEDREEHLVSIVEKASKTVVYVNSRAQAVSLTRFLRKRIPGRSERIAFYHAGLSRNEREGIEERFRQGSLDTVISTSAFGEGINIPDISDVVLFHLPFSIVAFNQMSGRAGRNGKSAIIHLLFNEKDAIINREILAPVAPSREELVVLYRTLKLLEKEHGPSVAIITSLDQLLRICQRIDPRCLFNMKGILNALAIFEELGLVKYEIIDNYLSISLPNTINRVELSASSRYLEGIEELALFEQFRQWVFKAGSEELQSKIISPLVPTEYGRVHGNG